MFSSRVSSCSLLAGIALAASGNLFCLRPSYERSRGPIDSSDLPLKITHVRGPLHLAEDFNYWKTNSVFYAHPEGIVFIDAGWSEKTARQLLWKAAVKCDADYLGVIVTGFQLHRTGGLAAFAENDVKIYMHEKTPELLESRWSGMQREMADFGSWREGPRVGPHRVFDKKLSILDGSVIVLYPGPAQTPDNLAVLFPRERVLYGGSLVSDPQYFMKDANLDNFVQALDFLNQFDFDLVISGHGVALQKRDIIERLKRRVATLRTARATQARTTRRRQATRARRTANRRKRLRRFV